MSDYPTNRQPLSIAAMLDKAELGSDDPLLLLAQIRVVNRFNNSVEQIISVVNTGQQDAGPNNTNLTASDKGGLYFRGVYYQPASFDVQIKEAAGEIPEIRMSVFDLAGIVRGYMETYQGGVGFKVRVMLVMQSSMSLPLADQVAEYQEDFTVVGASIDHYTASLTLGSTDLLAASFPRRLQIAQYCQWSYKSPNCGYSGPLATCDRTLQGSNGCAVHNNTLNFGGFPGIQGRGYA